MVNTWTTALRLEKPEVGAAESTWGATLNANTIDMIDEAVGGYVAISVAGGNVTLSTNNGTTDQARNAVIKFTGSPGADRTITAPDVEKTYWLINGVGDSSNILFKATGGATVTIPAGCQAKVYTDGATNSVILYLYGEGAWTPSDGSGASLTFTSPVGRWTRNGRAVNIEVSLTYPVTANGSAAVIAGLPFACNGTVPSHLNSRGNAGTSVEGVVNVSVSTITVINNQSAAVLNSSMSTQAFVASFHYTV